MGNQKTRIGTLIVLTTIMSLYSRVPFNQKGEGGEKQKFSNHFYVVKGHHSPGGDK